MPCLFNRVTELVNLELQDLTLKLTTLNDDPPNKNHLRDYEVKIRNRREVSSDKHFNLAADISEKRVELRVFTDKGFSGAVLYPTDIHDHVRIKFMKDTNFDTTGKVLVKGIKKADLPNRCCFIDRFIDCRGFRKLLCRDAFYDKQKMTDIPESTNKDPSSASIRPEQPSEEQTPKPQAPE